MRFASTVLFPSELAQTEKFSGNASVDGSASVVASEADRKAAQAEEDKKQRARLVSMGSVAASKAPADARTVRATSVPLTRAPTPPIPPAPGRAPPRVGAVRNGAQDDIERKVLRLTEMGFNAGMI